MLSVLQVDKSIAVTLYIHTFTHNGLHVHNARALYDIYSALLSLIDSLANKGLVSEVIPGKLDFTVLLDHDEMIVYLPKRP